MRFFALTSIIFVLISVQATAQQKDKQLPDSLTAVDSLKVLTKDFRSEPLTKMPIYNPKEIDAKILMMRPKGIIDNMPIVGKRDSLSGKGSRSYLGKDLPE